jgi:hypothetical protein
MKKRIAPARAWDSLSAKALVVIAGVSEAARSLPELAEYLPSRAVTAIALAAIVARIFTAPKS